MYKKDDKEPTFTNLWIRLVIDPSTTEEEKEELKRKVFEKFNRIDDEINDLNEAKREKCLVISNYFFRPPLRKKLFSFAKELIFSLDYDKYYNRYVLEYVLNKMESWYIEYIRDIIAGKESPLSDSVEDYVEHYNKLRKFLHEFSLIYPKLFPKVRAILSKMGKRGDYFSILNDFAENIRKAEKNSYLYQEYLKIVKQGLEFFVKNDEYFRAFDLAEKSNDEEIIEHFVELLKKKAEESKKARNFVIRIKRESKYILPGTKKSIVEKISGINILSSYEDLPLFKYKPQFSKSYKKLIDEKRKKGKNKV